MLNDLQFILNNGTESLEPERSPEGWDTGKLEIKRSLTYMGIFQTISNDLRFVKDGARFIRQAFYSQPGGVEANVELTINALDKIILEYKKILDGKLDMSTFTDTHSFVDALLVENSISKNVKDNESKEIEYLIGELIPDLLTNQLFVLDYGYTGSGTINHTALFFNWKNLFEKFCSDTLSITNYDFDILDSIENTKVLTTGLLVRSNPNNEIPKIKTTFLDAFKSLSAILEVGLGIIVEAGEQKLVLKPLSEMFDNETEIGDLGIVAEFKFYPLKELLFNAVEVGYPEQDAENTNIWQEFNGTSIFDPQMPSVKNKLEKTSKYRADYWGMATIYGDPTSDSQDEEIFIACVQPDSNEPLVGYRLTPGNRTTLIGDVVEYNVPISPRRLLEVHKDYLASAMDRSEEAELVFQTGSYSSESFSLSESATGGPYLSESTPLTVGSPVYFQPYVFEFNAAMSFQTLENLRSNPYGYLTFQYHGNQYKGFIYETKVPMRGKGIGNFKLLCCPDTDLSTLIR